jgi:molybdopterin adenylyltransferase
VVGEVRRLERERRKDEIGRTLDLGRSLQANRQDHAEEELRAQMEAEAPACDVTVTTGGTGIGSRDVTPDVVAGLADKLIPGVMEAIRVKSGMAQPRALLSRSVAALIGRALVYKLPGSVRAVEAYLGEILPGIEHAVCMVQGVDAH